MYIQIYKNGAVVVLVAVLLGNYCLLTLTPHNSTTVPSAFGDVAVCSIRVSRSFHRQLLITPIFAELNKAVTDRRLHTWCCQLKATCGLVGPDCKK